MSDTSTQQQRQRQGQGRRWRPGSRPTPSVALRALLCFALVGLCAAGHRPYQRGERRGRHPREHDQWAQHPVFPGAQPDGSQRVHFPWLSDEAASDRGQVVQYPTLEDAADGAQIEKCNRGYYRDGSGLYLGRCVPCDCNGLAIACEDKTGRCLNCDNNAGGHHCERCKEGYYGNATQSSCRVCPCPFAVASNSFALGCREGPSGFQCLCKNGYAGGRCERCAPGFYGDPMAPGGDCQPCHCSGNSCDSTTGVCNNTSEHQGTDTEGQCQECDSCAQTLLSDLERLDDGLGQIKTQLQNASASASSHDRLNKLEKAISETKILVNRFNSTIESQKLKVSQLEEDADTLDDDIYNLKSKADKQIAVAKKANVEAEKTEKRAEDLDNDLKNLLKKIKALLEELSTADTSDHTPAPGMSNRVDEAQRLVKEMEKRNFKPVKDAAEKEREEARKLLEYVKADVSAQCDDNQAAADKIKGQLKGYEAKLKDLERALKEATDTVKKATAQNGLNAKSIKDLLSVVEDLKKERKTVEDKMAKAADELQKTEDLADTLTDSKREYEQLAAQLDGAKRDLTKRVDESTRAADKEDVVRRAEEHADNLNKLSKDLQDIVRNASGRAGVRDAINAIDAYKNITDAINKAEVAANEAKAAADQSLNDVKRQDLPKQVKDLKANGDALLNQAKDAQKDLKSAAAALPAQQKRLKDADDKKKALEKDLLDVRTELDGINREDIRDMIDEAKQKASAANNVAEDTMDRLKEINNELSGVTISATDPNLNGIVDDVDKTVKDLLSKIPNLEDKLSEVENLTSQLTSVTNITENIKKIKDLIEKARDAANTITVPMTFKGNGLVELRPPSNLEDLKAYTQMSLSLQRPESRGDGRRRRQASQISKAAFVLYLGSKDSSKDYIGMGLKDNELFCVFKLNGVEYKIKSGTLDPSVSEPAMFHKVDLHRIYQDARVTLTKFYSSNKPSPPEINTKQGEKIENLLNLSPNDVVFYVGGAPADFTLPASLNYPNYTGCIEFSSFNDRFISLYNFKKVVNINPDAPCKRYLPSTPFSYFEGTGYAKLKIEKEPPVLLMGQSLITHSENGLLLYIGNEEKYFTVTLEMDHVVLRSNQFKTPVKSKDKLHDNTLTDILVILERGKRRMLVKVNGKEVVGTEASYNAKDFSEYYIGGLPSDLRERNNITIPAIKACVRNVKFFQKYATFDETVGVGRGCPEDLLAVRKAELASGSSLANSLADFSLGGDASVSLGFKSTEDQGLLLDNSPKVTGVRLELVGGHVIVKVGDKVWKSDKQYQDGEWHYLTVTKTGQSIGILIDDKHGTQPQPDQAYQAGDGQVSLGGNSFKGCISNVYLRRPSHLYQAEDLTKFTSTGDVLLGMCSSDRPPMMILDSSPKM